MFDRLMTLLRQGHWVWGIHPEVSRRLLSVADRCHELNSLKPSDTQRRERLLRDLIGSMGEGCIVHSPFRCDFGYNISLGDRVTVNFGMTVLDEAEVRIGSRVFIGPNVSIYTIIHALNPEQRIEGVMRAAPVTIEDDVWICGDVRILPGVTVGRGAVIGSGSVVTRSIPPMCLAAGNPCRVIREITDADRVEEIMK